MYGKEVNSQKISIIVNIFKEISYLKEINENTKEIDDLWSLYVEYKDAELIDIDKILSEAVYRLGKENVDLNNLVNNLKIGFLTTKYLHGNHEVTLINQIINDIKFASLQFDLFNKKSLLSYVDEKIEQQKKYLDQVIEAHRKNTNENQIDFFTLLLIITTIACVLNLIGIFFYD